MEFVVLLILQYFKNFIKTVATMYHNGQTFFFCPTNLGFESYLLFLQRTLVPLQIYPDFTDSAKLSFVQPCLDKFQLFYVGFWPDRGRMQAHHQKNIIVIRLQFHHPSSV